MKYNITRVDFLPYEGYGNEDLHGFDNPLSWYEFVMYTNDPIFSYLLNAAISKEIHLDNIYYSFDALKLLVNSVYMNNETIILKDENYVYGFGGHNNTKILFNDPIHVEDMIHIVNQLEDVFSKAVNYISMLNHENSNYLLVRKLTFTPD